MFYHVLRVVLFRCELCCSKCGALPDVLSVEVFNFETIAVLSICPSLYNYNCI